MTSTANAPVSVAPLQGWQLRRTPRYWTVLQAARCELAAVLLA